MLKSMKEFWPKPQLKQEIMATAPELVNKFFEPAEQIQRENW